MRALIEAHDWSASPLGPPATWPQSLRTTVGLMLPAMAQIVLFWGPDYVAVYNDAYAPTIGDKHPRALGRPAREHWAELWDDLEPLLRSVRETGETVFAKDRPFHIERHGYPETVYFDISYSAVLDESGGLGGVLCIVSETTERVLGERRVRENEARFHAMADSIDQMIWSTRPDGFHDYYNRRWYEYTGVPEGSTDGEAWNGMFHPDDQERAWGVWRHCLETGEPYHIEYRLRHRSGEYRWVLGRAQPVRDAGGEIARWYGTCTDIHDFKLAERALLESEARFRAMANSAPSPVWVTNANGIEFVNIAFTEFAGLPQDGLSGTVWTKLIHPNDLADVLSIRDEAWVAGSDYGYDARFRHADGGWRWMKVNCRTRFDGAGALVGYVGMAVDITEAKLAAEKLHDEKAALETLNRIGASLAPELDLQRVVQMVTDAGVALSGAQFGAFFYNVMNAAGESYMLYAISGVDRSEFDKFPMPRNTAVFAPTFQGEGVVRSDDISRDPRYGHSEPYRGMPKGHLPVASYLAVPVVSRSGEVIGGLFFGHEQPGRFTDRHEQLLVGIAGQAAVAIDNARLYEAAQREIADRKLAEEALRELNQSLEGRVAAAIADREQAEEALRQSQKMEAVGQLTGGIAHDFNNLLTVITGNVDAARRHVGDQGEPRIVRALGNALVGAERAAVLTQRLLAFSRRQPLNPRPVDANKLVTGMSELLYRTLGETIEVETVLAAGLWRIEADPNQLENAILNLAVNARDAMTEGGKLTIETANTHLDRDYAAQNAGVVAGQYVAICVSDTGAGMDPDTLARAIEPFFTTKEVGKGTGLGLSMVYGFVKQSGGHLKIYSEEAEGTTIQIYLPRQLGGEEGTEERPEEIVPEGSREETILVCEDDDDVRAYTVEVLRELGYRVLEAHDGPSALRLLERQEGKVDLLFTDVVLPSGMTGAVVAQEARTLRPDIKILFTTGYARNAIVHHGRLDPGVELITKPFAYADLAARVRDMLDRA
jgi:PAS domain S-box-containing protein